MFTKLVTASLTFHLLLSLQPFKTTAYMQKAYIMVPIIGYVLYTWWVHTFEKSLWPACILSLFMTRKLSHCTYPRSMLNSDQSSAWPHCCVSGSLVESMGWDFFFFFPTNKNSRYHWAWFVDNMVGDLMNLDIPF